LGNTLNDLKRFDEAEANYRKAIELNPQYATAYNNLGSFLDDLKRLDEAEANYRKAIELNPQDATAYNNLGNTLKDLKRFDEAEANYRKAIELNPQYATAYNNLGILLHFTLEKYNEAESSYRKVIEIDPTQGSAHFLLGILLRDQLNHSQEAEISLLKAIELDFSNIFFCDGLARLYRFNLEGRMKDAIPLLEKMLELDKENYNHYLAISSVKKELGISVLPEHLENANKFMPEDDWYNRACLESVRDNFDLAFDHLRKAAQKEEFNPKWAWEDPDLQWIRNDQRFAEIVGPKPE
jgi:superkiller protein 3